MQLILLAVKGLYGTLLCLNADCCICPN